MKVYTRSPLFALAALLIGTARLLGQDVRATAGDDVLIAEPEIYRVTVYRRGAVVERRGQLTLPAGPVALRIDSLENDFDSTSIRLSFGGAARVYALTAGTQRTYAKDTCQRLNALRQNVSGAELAVELAQAEVDGLESELAVFAANRSVASPAGRTGSTEQLRALAETHRRSITAASTALVLAKRRVVQLKATRDSGMARVDSLRARERETSGYVEVRLLVTEAGSFPFELGYLVGAAGWTPSYDLYVEPEVEGEAELVLVGEVSQSTGRDWTSVQIALSTGDPHRRLAPGRLPPRYLGESGFGSGRVEEGPYNPQPSEVSGTVYNLSGEPLIGASVHIDGTSMATVTDLDGQYALSLPVGASRITFTYLGYERLSTKINSARVSAFLGEGATSMDEVIVGYGGGLAGRVAGVASTSRAGQYSPPATFAAERSALGSIVYDLDRPLSVPSSGTSVAVRLRGWTLPLRRRYRIAARIEPTAYLEGVLSGYDTLGLVPAPLRLSLAGRYLGQTYLDASATGDSLTIGLGADERIAVERVALHQERDRRTFSSRYEYDLGFELSMHNRLAAPVEIVIEDQIPVSRRDNVEIELAAAGSGADYDPETGRLVWQVELAPGQRTSREVEYRISAPQHVDVRFE